MILKVSINQMYQNLPTLYFVCKSALCVSLAHLVWLSQLPKVIKYLHIKLYYNIPGHTSITLYRIIIDSINIISVFHVYYHLYQLPKISFNAYFKQNLYLIMLGKLAIFSWN